MSFFGDFRNAMDTYAPDSLRVVFIDFELIEAGNVLNTQEWFRCHVQAFNDGELNLTRVEVSVDATSYTRLQFERYPDETFTQMILDFGDMPAHSSKQYSRWIYGFATAATTGPQDVVTAKFYRWYADLAHLLKVHSSFGPIQGRINVQIFPD